MLSRPSQLWFKFSSYIISCGLGRFLAGLWHKLMPCFPVRRTIFGLQVYFDSRDHPFVWYVNRHLLEEAENLPQTLGKYSGRFWDCGCNAGIYSLWMASRGNPVVSFDMSPKAISYVLKSAAKNKLTNLTGIPRAFSTESFQYETPQTAIAGNRLKSNDAAVSAVTIASYGATTGTTSSMTAAITYLEAAEKYGMPTVIKMDIEGHEEQFLKSAEFKQWIIGNKITLIMELHDDRFWQMLWPEVKQTKLSQNMVVLNPQVN